MTGEPGGAPSPDQDPLLGTLIADRYRLLEKIGEGGMGSVYRGVHETLRKPVAVKILGRAARADRELVTRFEREAVAAANLKHPNIAEATDSGQMPDGTLFLVMEYVQGRSLRALIAQGGRLPPARALHLLRQMSSALIFAHGREVVHRDLKPENVLVFDRGDERDVVKVIDFGIARMRSAFGGGPSGLTKVGSVVGTVDYMAPEQAMGQAVDARADQYTLGVIAFELLTGRQPYQADDVASLVYMHVGAPIPRVTEHAPELGAYSAVDDVVATMMGKLPDERFPSVSEAIAALGLALERPTPAPSALPQPQPSAPNMSLTASGTIISPLRAAARPPQAPAGTAPVPAPTPAPVPAPAPASAAPRARPRNDVVLILVSLVISAIGVIVIVAIFLARYGASSDPGTIGPPATDDPPTLAPTSHDPRGKGKPKGKGR